MRFALAALAAIVGAVAFRLLQTRKRFPNWDEDTDWLGEWVEPVITGGEVWRLPDGRYAISKEYR